MSNGKVELALIQSQRRAPVLRQEPFAVRAQESVSGTVSTFDVRGVFEL